MNNYKKFTMWFFGLELFLIAIANGLYYMTANNQKTDIERLQDKTDTIYKIIYMQTDYRTWILMNISLGILFLLSVFSPFYWSKSHKAISGNAVFDGRTGKGKFVHADKGREK